VPCRLFIFKRMMRKVMQTRDCPHGHKNCTRYSEKDGEREREREREMDCDFKLNSKLLGHKTDGKRGGVEFV
jgi:hypothetical protein